MPHVRTAILLPIAGLQEPKPATTGPSERGEAAGTTAPGGPQGPQGTGGAGPGVAPEPCGTQPMLMAGLFLVVVWFMVLRPESRRRKESQAMLNALKQGDTVVTIGGMHGVVDRIDERIVVLRVGDQRMTFDRTAVARVVRDEPARAQGKS